jgi:hypothetical protein
MTSPRGMAADVTNVALSPRTAARMVVYFIVGVGRTG